MPQMTPVVLTDNAFTDHTFAPRGIDANGVATLVRSTGVPVGDERLTISRTRTAQGREKTLVKMTLPVVSTVSEGGISRPSVVRTAYADITFSFDGTSSTLERANARKMLADFLNNSESIASSVVDDLETLY